MDGRDAEALGRLLDLTIQVGDPLDTDHPQECPRCGFDTMPALVPIEDIVEALSGLAQQEAGNRSRLPGC